MEHHCPDQCDGDRGRHHRHDEDAAQKSAQRKLRIENQRCQRSEEQGSDDRQHGIDERMPKRFPESGIAGEPDIVLKTDKALLLSQRPAMGAHPEGENPRKNDHRGDDDKCRYDEWPVVGSKPRGLAPLVLAGSRCCIFDADGHHYPSLRERTGANCSVAFLSSAAGSAPPIMLVRPTP